MTNKDGLIFLETPRGRNSKRGGLLQMPALSALTKVRGYQTKKPCIALNMELPNTPSRNHVFKNFNFF
jgi:hypothetical protein